jgi:hypothetical protein
MDFKEFTKTELIEIAEYVRVASQSTPNVRTIDLVEEYLRLKSNQEDDLVQSLYQEAKKKYPKGTYFQTPFGVNLVVGDEPLYRVHSEDIDVIVTVSGCFVVDGDSVTKNVHEQVLTLDSGFRWSRISKLPENIII